MKQPPRLIDDPEAGARLRDDLQRAASAAPVRYDAAAGLASLQAAIAAPSVSPATGAESAACGSAATTGATGTASVATKVALGSLGAVALIAGAVAVTTIGGPAPRSPAQPAWPAASAAAPANADAPSPPSAAAVPSSTEPAAELASDELPQRALPPDPDGKLRREIAQVARIKALLRRSPGDAYRLAQQGNREFPNGVLVQEREGLAILSLAALGRRAEASRRAETFLSRFPDSPLRERIAKIAAADRAP